MRACRQRCREPVGEKKSQESFFAKSSEKKADSRSVVRVALSRMAVRNG